MPKKSNIEHICETFILTSNQISEKKIQLSNVPIPQTVIFRCQDIPYNYQSMMKVDFDIINNSDNKNCILTWDPRILSSSILRKPDLKIYNFLQEGSRVQVHYVKSNQTYPSDNNYIPLESFLSVYGTKYKENWYRSNVIVQVSATEIATGIFLDIDGTGFERRNMAELTENGKHIIRFYCISEDKVESVNTRTIYIDKTEVNIENILIDKPEWYPGDGEVKYTVFVGEDTEGWSGIINLSEFGKSKEFPLTPQGSSMIASFIPDKKETSGKPEVQVFDQAGNSDKDVAPELITHKVLVEKEDLYFEPFSYISNSLPNGKKFSNPQNVKVSWGKDFTRYKDLRYQIDYIVKDDNKIQLTKKWKFDVEANSLGLMYVTVSEE